MNHLVENLFEIHGLLVVRPNQSLHQLYCKVPFLGGASRVVHATADTIPKPVAWHILVVDNTQLLTYDVSAYTDDPVNITELRNCLAEQYGVSAGWLLPSAGGHATDRQILYWDDSSFWQRSDLPNGLDKASVFTVHFLEQASIPEDSFHFKLTGEPDFPVAFSVSPAPPSYAVGALISVVREGVARLRLSIMVTLAIVALACLLYWIHTFMMPSSTVNRALVENSIAEKEALYASRLKDIKADLANYVQKTRVGPFLTDASGIEPVGVVWKSVSVNVPQQAIIIRGVTAQTENVSEYARQLLSRMPEAHIKNLQLSQAAEASPGIAFTLEITL